MYVFIFLKIIVLDYIAFIFALVNRFLFFCDIILKRLFYFLKYLWWWRMLSKWFSKVGSQIILNIRQPWSESYLFGKQTKYGCKCFKDLATHTLRALTSGCFSKEEQRSFASKFVRNNNTNHILWLRLFLCF